MQLLRKYKQLLSRNTYTIIKDILFRNYKQYEVTMWLRKSNTNFEIIGYFQKKNGFF